MICTGRKEERLNNLLFKYHPLMLLTDAAAFMAGDGVSEISGEMEYPQRPNY